ncbi:hypothetical protein Y032_0031g2356 [Ancylostoma ceylanicum]|nr:hypothetical protein Y032_0031g2356 [Ancylostoma ceylanicum]
MYEDESSRLANDCFNPMRCDILHIDTVAVKKMDENDDNKVLHGKNESLHLRRVWVQFYIPILSPILNLNSHKRSNNWRTKMWTEEKELFDSVENISDFGLLAFAAEFAWCENSKNLEK